MDHPDHDWNRIPWWSFAGPIAASCLIGATLVRFISPDNTIVIALAVAFLVPSVFAAEHHAEVLAIKTGEPFGAIILALSITVLEVGLIILVMVSGASGGDAIARNTIFSVVMIVLNGIVGLCLIVGAARHYEQEFHVQGASAVLSVIATLAIISMVLPNYTLTTPGPTFASSQLLFLSAVSLILYLLFVFVQTVLHRTHFVTEAGDSHRNVMPTALTTIASMILLIMSLIAVIQLAKILSPVVERSVVSAGLPITVVGVVIAAMVLLPEGVTALKAARRNRLQTSLNASLGSAAASIGLTIPIIGAVSVYLGQSLTLGLDQEEMLLLLLTLFVSTLTFATGRTTVLQGAVHLVIFGVFLFLSAVP